MTSEMSYGIVSIGITKIVNILYCSQLSEISGWDSTTESFVMSSKHIRGEHFVKSNFSYYENIITLRKYKKSIKGSKEY